jgi:hypothetical protein
LNDHEIAVATLNSFDRDGWCQHTILDLDGSRCLLGHVGNAVRLTVRIGLVDRSPVCRAADQSLAESLGFRGGFDYGLLGRWNDRPERTADEVRAALVKWVADTAPPPAIPELEAKAVLA